MISKMNQKNNLLPNQLEIIVKDTGRGIEPVQLERMFSNDFTKKKTFYNVQSVEPD